MCSIANLQNIIKRMKNSREKCSHYNFVVLKHKTCSNRR